MKKIIFIIVSGLMLAGCSQNSQHQAVLSTAPVNLPELSEAGLMHCTTAGGIQAVARQLDGGLESVCALPNGKRCAESSLVSGGCS